MAAAHAIRVDGLFPGVPYDYAVLTDAGARLLFLAGSCPLDEDGRVVAPTDVVGQSKACLENLRAALDAGGATLDDLVFVRVLVASAQREELAAAWGVVAAALADGGPPPGTLQGVTALGWPEQLVEIEAVAALLPRRRRNDWTGRSEPQPRSVL